MQSGLYRVNAHRRINGRAVPYTLAEIDFFAAYVIPKIPGSSSRFLTSSASPPSASTPNAAASPTPATPTAKPGTSSTNPTASSSPDRALQ
ncbi:MAG: hypothetical protein WCA49_05210 [Candidatus Sulfotelmatobacter sp.]